MAFTGILRPGHIALRVLDLEAAVRHYTDIVGLKETARDGNKRVFLKAWDEHDHHSVVLREADSPGIDYLGWRVDSPDTLMRLAADLEKSSLVSHCEWIAAGEHPETGRRLRFIVPTGHSMEIYAEKRKVGNGMSDTNPEVWPDGLTGMSPSRFDHCLLYGDGLDEVVKLFTEVLGFTIAEQVVVGPDQMLMAAFLTCSNKPHDVAFIRQPVKNKLHHVSFFLESWNDVLRAADIITKHRVSHDVGPTRHGLTRGTTVYFFDPSGNRNEVFSGGYIHYPDKPTLTWTDDELARAVFYHDRAIDERFMAAYT